ncbi:MAG TPA: low temperature requirement protein A, partial [Acidimicrobiia bacterium]|nr:low temperature requirement protein A [Acidimicrobiia bacterium]
VLAGLELAVPVWAETTGRTSWHPGHIAERYGLFTLIVLGESVLAATVAVQVALDGTTPFADLAPVVVGGILTVFFMWWMYFDMPAEQAVGRIRQGLVDRPSGPFIWGYGHYLVFASAAAVGAGLAVAVDQVTHHSKLSETEAGFALTVPVTIFIAAVWVLHFRHKVPGFMRSYAVPVAGALILASSLTPEPVLATGILLAALIAASVIGNCLRPRPAPSEAISRD